MKKHMMITLCAAVASLAVVGALAGCSAFQKAKVVGDVIATAVSQGDISADISLMPADHADRFDTLGGAQGCYTCHGVKDDGATQRLATATALPDTHYLGGTKATAKLDPVRAQCYTCHVVSAE